MIGIIPNITRDKELSITKAVLHALAEQGIVANVSTDIARQIGREDLACEESELCSKAELLIAIGGDGTILNTVQKSISSQVPILGINSGRLGFLAELESKDIRKYLTKERLLNAKVEERMVLSVTVTDEEGNENSFYVLNEVSLIRSHTSRITEIETCINNRVNDLYPADGILVATPTGSTAYNLSAGGPIVMPYAKNFILTPICPHTIYSRTIVLAQTDVVGIRIMGAESLSLCVDGEAKMSVNKQYIIEVKEAPYVVKLLRLTDLDFFETLRKKIVERGR
ncbi:MAG: hypothetical protein BEN18_09560 [Epulopiscium sp. Nuni2H_MBin001]|nr:MAG: hypothetical protein BEN18_09560 [Epulopiscium sp. Nuni2H_MBin001]